MAVDRRSRSVDGHAADAIRQARTGGHQPGHVEALLALRDGAANDEVVDLIGGQLGDTLQHALKGEAAHGHRMHIPQGALFS